MNNMGNLDHTITLESPTQANVGGELTTSWTNEGNEFAEIISKKAKEEFEAARLNARSIIRVRIHFRADVGTDWRMLWDGEYYYIQTVDRSARYSGELWFTAQLVSAR